MSMCRLALGLTLTAWRSPIATDFGTSGPPAVALADIGAGLGGGVTSLSTSARDSVYALHRAYTSPRFLPCAAQPMGALSSGSTRFRRIENYFI